MLPWRGDYDMTLELLQLGLAAYCMASGVPEDKIGEIYIFVMHQPLPKNMAETILQLDAAIEKVMNTT